MTWTFVAASKWIAEEEFICLYWDECIYFLNDPCHKMSILVEVLVPFLAAGLCYVIESSLNQQLGRMKGGN